MNKILATLLAFAVMSSVCFAEEAVPPSQDVPKLEKARASAGKTDKFEGKIVSLTFADAEKKTGLEALVVADKDENTATFTVTPATAVSGAASEALDAGQLKMGSKVKVIYSKLKRDTKQAETISVL